MSVEIRASGETVTAYLSRELDHHTARAMREAIDSSGIGLVMGRYRTLSKTGAELVISETPPQIYKVMKLAGLERLARLESR